MAKCQLNERQKDEKRAFQLVIEVFEVVSNTISYYAWHFFFLTSENDVIISLPN